MDWTSSMKINKYVVLVSCTFCINAVIAKEYKDDVDKKVIEIVGVDDTNNIRVDDNLQEEVNTEVENKEQKQDVDGAKLYDKSNKQDVDDVLDGDKLQSIDNSQSNDKLQNTDNSQSNDKLLEQDNVQNDDKSQEKSTEDFKKDTQNESGEIKKNESNDLKKDIKNTKKESRNGIEIKNLIIKENDLPLNLVNLIYVALQRNNATKHAYINIKIAERELAKQRSVYYPSLSANASYGEKDGDSYEYTGKVRGMSASLNLSYELFTFGKNSASVDAMKHYLSSTKYQYDQQVQDVIYNVIETYYGLLSLESKKTAAIETELLGQETYKAASLKYKIGVVPLVDKLKSKSSYSEYKLQRVQVENEIKKQKALLNNLLNLDPAYTLYVENPEINIKKINHDVEYYIEEAKKNRYDLKLLLSNRQQAVANLKAAKRDRYPTISLNGSVDDSKDLTKNSINDENIIDTTVSVSLNVPLFTGFGISNNIKIQKKNIESIDIQIEQKEKDISKEVWDAYQDFSTNQVSYFIAEDLLETATENAKVSLGMYKNGKASMLDVLDSQNQLESAKFNFINAKYNWLVYRMKLLKTIGKMDLENIINIDKL